MAPNRSENGIYTSPWGGLPDITPGTVYEHAFGRLRVHGAAHDADSRLAIADYVTGERWTCVAEAKGRKGQRGEDSGKCG